MGYRYHGHNHKRVRKVILIEFLIISMAILFATAVFNFIDVGHVEYNELVHYNTLICIAFLQISILSLGLYELKIREDRIGIFRRVLVSSAVAYFLCELFISQVATGEVPQYFVLTAVGTAFIFLSFFRLVFWDSEMLSVSKHNIVILGAGERASIIEKRMRRAADRRGIEICGFIKQDGDKEGQVQNETVFHFEGDAQLEEFVYENDITEVVIAADERRGTMPSTALFNFKLRGIVITDILDFIERETGQVAVTLIYPSWVIYSNGFRSSNHLKNAGGYLFNFLLAFTVLFLTAPILIITATMIYLDDGRKKGGTILYRQERIGKNGRVFNILKFRSMRMDAEAGGAQFAQKKDSRVTRLGEFIRKYRIDELPQLLNVIKGEMSFVGPRPERPEFVTDFIKEIPYYNQRHNVKPGLTGWAQLNYPYGSSTKDTIEKLKYDLYYIKHSSIILDMLILLRTAEVVLFGKGR